MLAAQFFFEDEDEEAETETVLNGASPKEFQGLNLGLHWGLPVEDCFENLDLEVLAYLQNDGAFLNPLKMVALPNGTLMDLGFRSLKIFGDWRPPKPGRLAWQIWGSQHETSPFHEPAASILGGESHRINLMEIILVPETTSCNDLESSSLNNHL